MKHKYVVQLTVETDEEQTSLVLEAVAEAMRAAKLPANRITITKGRDKP